MEVEIQDSLFNTSNNNEKNKEINIPNFLRDFPIRNKWEGKVCCVFFSYFT